MRRSLVYAVSMKVFNIQLPELHSRDFLTNASDIYTLSELSIPPALRKKCSYTCYYSQSSEYTREILSLSIVSKHTFLDDPR